MRNIPNIRTPYNVNYNNLAIIRNSYCHSILSEINQHQQKPLRNVKYKNCNEILKQKYECKEESVRKNL